MFSIPKMDELLTTVLYDMCSNSIVTLQLIEGSNQMDWKFNISDADNQLSMVCGILCLFTLEIASCTSRIDLGHGMSFFILSNCIGPNSHDFVDDSK
jgi:hypothetical protein